MVPRGVLHIMIEIMKDIYQTEINLPENYQHITFKSLRCILENYSQTFYMNALIIILLMKWNCISNQKSKGNYTVDNIYYWFLELICFE